MINYTGYAEYRRISPLLWLGLLTVPWLSVWFLLREGHSPRSRVIGFGLLGIVAAFALFSPKSEVAPETPSAPVVAEQKPPSAEDIETAKREKIVETRKLLDAAFIREGETAEAFNKRVSGLYNAWASAQRDLHGEDWAAQYGRSGISEAYLNCRREMNRLGISDGGMFDLSDFNTPADVACRQRGFEMHPRAPQLSDYLVSVPTNTSTGETVTEERAEPVVSEKESAPVYSEREG